MSWLWVEILSASDEETERPKVEPCSLAFCVSHVAVRVHVLDAGFFLTVSPDSIAVGSSCSILADNRLWPSLVSCCSSS